MAREPTDEELMSFAAELLGPFGDTLRDTHLLGETVTENHDLWLQLYRVGRGLEEQRSD